MARGKYLLLLKKPNIDIDIFLFWNKKVLSYLLLCFIGQIIWNTENNSPRGYTAKLMNDTRYILH